MEKVVGRPATPNYRDQKHTSFLMGKSRVAPLKQVTIPRMELTVAAISLKMDRMLKQELQLHLKESVFWADSVMVLKYIENDAARYKTFVANRVSFIREATEPSQWKYVNTAHNPADQASRGLRAESLLQKMAAAGMAKTGMLSALFVYAILRLLFLNSRTSCAFNGACNDCDGRSVPILQDPGPQQPEKPFRHKHFGYGQDVVAKTFLSHIWNYPSRRTKGVNKTKRTSDLLIIYLNLLLAGMFTNAQVPGRLSNANSRNTPVDINIIYMDNIQHPPVDNIQVSAHEIALREMAKLPTDSGASIQGVDGTYDRADSELGLLRPGLTTEANSNLTPAELDPLSNPGRLTTDTSPCLTPAKRLIQRGKDVLTKDITYLDNIFSTKGLHVLHLNIRSLLLKIHKIRLLLLKVSLIYYFFKRLFIGILVNKQTVITVYKLYKMLQKTMQSFHTHRTGIVHIQYTV